MRRLHDALDRRQLRAVVDAQDIVRVPGDACLDGNTLGDRERDDVGEIELTL